MIKKQGIPLTSISNFSPTITDQLATVWITTAEEFYAAARQQDGTQGLADFLHIAKSEVEGLMDIAIAVIPSDILFTDDEIEPHGLGVLDESEENQP